jgi:hypothetical protein
MSGPIAAVPVSELTSGVQLFRCVPYSCTMLARSCVVRQAQADSDFPPVSLLLCKGCTLGAEVKARAGGDVEVDPHAAARASRKHIAGLPQKPNARRAPALAPLPAASLPPPAPPPAPPPPTERTREETMPRPADLNGKEIAGVKVLRQLESAEKGTLWRVRFSCGHEEDLLGSILTAYARNGNTRHCKHCRAAGKDMPRARAKRAEGGSPSEAPAAARKAAARAKHPPPHTIIPSQASSVAHEFPLRRDFTARLELPSDLSKSDVARLARWLEVIAFDDGAE